MAPKFQQQIARFCFLSTNETAPEHALETLEIPVARDNRPRGHMGDGNPPVRSLGRRTR